MDPQSLLLTDILARIESTIQDLDLPLTTIPCWIGSSRQLPNGERVQISRRFCYVSVYPDDQISDEDAGPPYAADRILISHTSNAEGGLDVQMCLDYSKDNRQTINASYNFLQLLLACHLPIPDPRERPIHPWLGSDTDERTSMTQPEFHALVTTFHMACLVRHRRLQERAVRRWRYVVNRHRQLRQWVWDKWLARALRPGEGRLYHLAKERFAR